MHPQGKNFCFRTNKSAVQLSHAVFCKRTAPAEFCLWFAVGGYSYCVLLHDEQLIMTSNEKHAMCFTR